MEQSELKKILEAHKEWILSKGRRGKRADLSNANLSELDLSYANLREANLFCAYLRGANLTGANLYDANLREANLIKANLSIADLSNANLTRANLKNANIERADLSYVTLSGANITGANLGNTLITIADLEGIIGMIYVYSQYNRISYGYMHNNELRVRLGCFDRTVKEWNNDFWNNDGEFPENSPQGQNRLMIYKFMKEWLYKNFPGLE